MTLKEKMEAAIQSALEEAERLETKLLKKRSKRASCKTKEASENASLPTDQSNNTHSTKKA